MKISPPKICQIEWEKYKNVKKNSNDFDYFWVNQRTWKIEIPQVFVHETLKFWKYFRNWLIKKSVEVQILGNFLNLSSFGTRMRAIQLIFLKGDTNFFLRIRIEYFFFEQFLWKIMFSSYKVHLVLAISLIMIENVIHYYTNVFIHTSLNR